MAKKTLNYTESDIQSLDWREHIRSRPGMYIGKFGNGSDWDDGIYILLKEVLDNSVDEYIMGFGKRIEIQIDSESRVEVRDYGRGIPLGKLMDCAAKINTGAKYDSEAFRKSVGLNGVGIKAVNALSSFFEIQSWRENKTKAIEFSQGKVVEEMKTSQKSSEKSGTKITFEIDRNLFPSKTQFSDEHVHKMCRYYAYLNLGLKIFHNNHEFLSRGGLLDLLKEEIKEETIYPPVLFQGKEIDIAFTYRTKGNAEIYFSFVNGQHTIQGGTHLAAFREAFVKVVRKFYKKQYDSADIRAGLSAAISLRIQDPIFESQTKTKLGSTHIEAERETLKTFFSSFLQEKLEKFLFQEKEISGIIQQKIVEAERERKELKTLQKLAQSRGRKTRIYNKKLRDSRFHYNTSSQKREETTLFITEGDSATGSMTQSRDPEIQAVFSLRGKPLNCYGISKKIVYENEEFHLLQNALNIEDGLEGLRYNRVVIATDADVDGMHIRLLLLTFFLQFFPSLVNKGHLFILETPLFRVRNKKQTKYCYDEKEKIAALEKLGKGSEIVRFKGLGEISPNEFSQMIGKDMRLHPVPLSASEKREEMLSFYMGKNSQERQAFIVENLRDITTSPKV